MKETIYTCDQCNAKTNDLEASGWIEFGSKGNSLYINSHLPDARVYKINDADAIHFCSSTCLLYQFSRKEPLTELADQNKRLGRDIIDYRNILRWYANPRTYNKLNELSLVNVKKLTQKAIDVLKSGGETP